MIEVDGVSKRFGPRRTLDGLILVVRAGEVFGLAGPAGGGEATTLRFLATLVRPDEGTVAVAGIPVDRDPRAARRLVGYLPEPPGFCRPMTVQEDLELHAGVHGVARPRRRPLAGELLEVIGLEDQRKDEVATPTTGRRRRLGLARASSPTWARRPHHRLPGR